MISAPTVAERFVRRPSLGDDEYRVNFKQIDCDVLDSLASDEACAITPSMSKIYIRLIRSPLMHWEREGVLRFVGEEREGKQLTAWEQLRELTGVANSTLSKALSWMHNAGVIGFIARKNGVGIRIFINRARSSIRSKGRNEGRSQGGEKNLRLVPAPSDQAPAPSDGIPFKEKNGRKDLDKDITPRAHSRAAERLTGHELPAITPAERLSSKLTGSIDSGAQVPSNQIDIGQLMGMVRRELEPVIASRCSEVITSALHKEAELNREWFEKAGLPKAIRVAQHETFDVLRSHGVITKKVPNSGKVDRRRIATEEGREATNEQIGIVAFLAKARDAISRAAMSDLAVEKPALRTAYATTERELEDLLDHIAAGEKASPMSPLEVENRLAAAEERLIGAIWQSTDSSRIETMLKSARTELQRYETTMESEVFNDALRRHVTASLREQYGLPRLSLFYL
jgi:hypothetical protein